MQSITEKTDELPLISMNFEVKSSIEEKVLLGQELMTVSGDLGRVALLV